MLSKNSIYSLLNHDSKQLKCPYCNYIYNDALSLFRGDYFIIEIKCERCQRSFIAQFYYFDSSFTTEKIY